jgi:hypothetical protein
VIHKDKEGRKRCGFLENREVQRKQEWADETPVSVDFLDPGLGAGDVAKGRAGIYKKEQSND